MNYTLVCTIANTALHIIYKCVREYMVSDYRWLTLYRVLGTSSLIQRAHAQTKICNPPTPPYVSVCVCARVYVLYVYVFLMLVLTAPGFRSSSRTCPESSRPRASEAADRDKHAYPDSRLLQIAEIRFT